MKKLLILLISMLCPLSLFSQSISTDVISSAGETFESNEYTLDWTVGEGVVDFLFAEGKTLSLGFHQTDIILANLSEDITESVSKVFPNPTQNHITIEYGDKDRELSITITDLLGRKYLEKKVLSESSVEIDMTDFPNGNYLLEIMTEQGEKSIYKIIKLK